MLISFIQRNLTLLKGLLLDPLHSHIYPHARTSSKHAINFDKTRYAKHGTYVKQF